MVARNRKKSTARSSIREFWRRLDRPDQRDGEYVHPDDAEVFASHSHTFNLQYPPPAFVGNVDNAPVIILKANGGYDPNPRCGTCIEFPDQDAHIEHLLMLTGEGVHIPSTLSRYYKDDPLFSWIKDGGVAIVNAVAYRSPKSSNELQDKRVARLLPSAKVHKQWLHDELFPAANRGANLWSPTVGDCGVFHSEKLLSKVIFAVPVVLEGSTLSTL